MKLKGRKLDDMNWEDEAKLKADNVSNLESEYELKLKKAIEEENENDIERFMFILREIRGKKLH